MRKKNRVLLSHREISFQKSRRSPKLSQFSGRNRMNLSFCRNGHDPLCVSPLVVTALIEYDASVL